MNEASQEESILKKQQRLTCTIHKWPNGEPHLTYLCQICAILGEKQADFPEPNKTK